MGLRWNGDAVFKDVEAAASATLQRFGLRHEGEAKKELRKGHGVLTGTLRRSIHTETPSYVWISDNVPPSESSPDRGGDAPKPEKKRDVLWITTGSGLVYALAVHQGHHDFGGYHYMTLSFDKLNGQKAIIDDFRSEMRKRGYR